MESSKSIQSLSSGWSFKQGAKDSTSEWLSAAAIPSEVHTDLLHHKKIPDPYINLNELAVRWVGDETWTYRAEFPTPQSFGLPGFTTDLVFQGLDTFATVYLNGLELLVSDNMFVEHRINVASLLAWSDEKKTNTLEIVFEPARARGLELVKQHPEHRFIVHQTEVSRGPVRKAQYHWGWDWGPILMTCGIWKPINVETYEVRIEDLWVKYDLSDDLKKVEGELFGIVPECENYNLNVTFELSFADGLYIAPFSFSEPSLWWPRNYGAQNLYTISMHVSSQKDTILSTLSKSIGFRSTALVQEKDAIGTSFYFRINNVDIFCGGSCWIPADNLLSQITPDRYRQWLELTADGNQTMIRVWGGGIYETDTFYDACDELGVLVWQDFAFACALYPTYDSYLKSVELEARQNARRLRNHPALVIWAGNNEDYQLIERYGLEYNFEEDKDPESWLRSTFPARYIYEHLLPKIVSEETKGMIYHPSSPWGNGVSTTLKVDQTVGDVHQWNVWHGEMRPYQHLPQMGGRFVSEFGMEAYPHLETLKSCVTDPSQQYPGSRMMDFRNKAIGHERRMVIYLAENFRIADGSIETFTHLTQVMQADAMSWAYSGWRRQWRSRGDRKCGGVLVWQLNDSWPTVSWGVVDYWLVKKPAWYAIKRAMEPVAIGVERKFHDWTLRKADELWQRDTGHVDPVAAVREVSFDLWVASSRLEPIEGVLDIRYLSVSTGKPLYRAITKTATITPNGTTEVFTDYKPEDPLTEEIPEELDPYLIHITFAVEGKVIATHVSWPDPIKYLNFDDRGVKAEYSDDKQSVTITTARPVKGFVFSERRGVKLSDNGFDIMPDEKKVVAVEGIEAKELHWRYVGA
ncbi:glycoside hydrolase [Lophium mytilinum]|uniref:Beta-mannosidase B n=1 Tax=Lophium mytilinum TaxID=390894 RepID=A0A6A6QRB0_9PEZI|nr:glycoside hydrolase [Lophium mytilinum]